MERLALLFVALVLACSGASDPVVTPEAPPVSAPPTSVAPPPSEASAPPSEPVEPEIDSGIPPAPLAQTAAPSIVRGRYVPRLDVESVLLPSGQTVRVRHPNATVRSRLDALIEQQINDLATELRAASADQQRETEEVPTCSAPLATRSVVSVVCRGYAVREERGDSSGLTIEGATFEIVGDDVHAITLADALIEGANIDHARDVARDEAIARDLESSEHSGGDWTLSTEVLGADGIHSVWVDPTWGEWIESTVPYASILDRVRGDGAIARLLRLGSFARGATPPATTTEGEPSEGPWAIGAPIPIGETATLWLSLADRLRPAVSLFVSEGDGLAQLGATPDVGIDTAREIATALHGALIAPSTASQLRRFVVVRATGSVNVRTTPESGGAWIGTLPLGATALAPIDPTSATRPTWLTVIAAPGLVGHSASRYLADTDCTPDPASVIASLPATEREEEGRHVLRIVTSAILEGHTVPAALFVSPSHLWLRGLSSTCRTGSAIGAWTLSDVVDVLVTRTMQRSGQTLVLAATATPHDETEARWHALAIGTPESVWDSDALAHPSVTNDVVAPARRGPSGRGFWPLAIVQRRRPIVTFHWDGSTLAQDTP